MQSNLDYQDLDYPVFSNIRICFMDIKLVIFYDLLQNFYPSNYVMKPQCRPDLFCFKTHNLATHFMLTCTITNAVHFTEL